MKKYIYLLMMVLIAVSCEETDAPLENPGQENTPSTIPATLHAIISKAESRAIWDTQPLSWEGIDCVDSRTYAKPEGTGDEYYNQYWSSGDAISYFETTQNLKYISDIVENNDEYIANFTPAEGATGTGEALTTGYYYGVYPYKEDTKIDTKGTVTFTFPEEQEYCEDSYAKGANGMIARHQSADEDLYFLNFCSYLQLQLTSEDSTKVIDKIILKANDSHNFMAGVGTITFNTDDMPEVTMDHEISINHLILNCKDKGVTLNPETPTKFWFVLPGNFTFTDGFSITVAFTDGTYYKRTTKEGIAPIKIERNHIKPLGNLPIVPGDIKNSVIRYKYLNPAGNSTNYFDFTANSFKDENGRTLTPKQEYDEEKQEWVITFDGILYSVEENAFHNTSEPDLDWIIFENAEPIVLETNSFWECTANEITFNNNIINIEAEAFSESYTTKITINGDIHNIEEKAFDFTPDLEEIKIVGSVENIEERAFATSGLETIIVTNRITNIGQGCFEDCANLTNVSLNGLEHIEDYAFAECTSLEYIDLGHVHRIGASAFKSCSKLNTVKISGECISIGEGAFAACRRLKTVIIYAENPPELLHDNNNPNPYTFHDNTTIYVPDGSFTKYNDDPTSTWWYYSTNNTETTGAKLAKMSTLTTES